MTALRDVRLGHRFWLATARLHVSTDEAKRRDLARTLRALETAKVLPSAGDVVALMPPSLHVFVRRVPRRNLWVWYRIAHGTVFVVHLSAEPPMLSE